MSAFPAYELAEFHAGFLTSQPQPAAQNVRRMRLLAKELIELRFRRFLEALGFGALGPVEGKYGAAIR